MPEFFVQFFKNTWYLTAEMAPYLILGFLTSGLLFWFIRPKAIEQLLGKPSLSAIIKACLVGVPMPLCSCSVIPVAASLRKGGASRGATTAFISATPQTGIDSIFATYSLMGGLFTIVRVVVAFISGIITGLLVELSYNHQNQTERTDDTEIKDHSVFEAPKPTLIESLKYGFVKLPSSLATALIIGLLLAGLITSLLPPDLFTNLLHSEATAFLLATLIGLPLYVCATASIPMAYAFITAGLSPGAALVFLIVGPATNTATIATLWQITGRKATVIYLVSLTVISWLAGWIFNSSVRLQSIDSMHVHESAALTFWKQASGILLIAILVVGLYSKHKGRHKVNNGCCS